MTDSETTAAPPDPRLEQAKAYLANEQYPESIALLTELLSLPNLDAAVELATEFGATLIGATDETRQTLLSALLQQPDGIPYVIGAMVDQGDLERALQVASQLCDCHPADTRFALLYGWLLLRDGQFEAALETAARVGAAEPTNLESQALKTETHLAQGDQLSTEGAGEDAIAAYRLSLGDNDALLAGSPETPQIYLQRAQIHIRLNDGEAAISDYGQALDLAPDYLGAYIGRAQLQVALEHWDKASTDVASALEIDPKDLEALALRADIRAAQGDASASEGDFTGAEQAYRDALVDYDSLAERTPDEATVFLNRARTRRKVEDDEGSIADYDRAIKLDPELAGAYNERGVLREFAGDYELALADYEQFLGLVPNEPVGYLNRADALLALNRFDTALVSYEKALALQPDFLEAHLGHARALGLLGRWDEAVAAVEAALKEDPGRQETIGLRADIHAAHGDVASDEGDFSGAEQAYRRALDDYDQLAEDAPEAPGVFLSRAQTYSKLNEIDAALADYARVIELDPESAIAYNGRGLIYEQQARFEDALAEYEQVASLLPDDPVGWRNRADCLLALDRFDDALASYRRALEHAPHFIEAHLGHARAGAALGHWDAAIADVEHALEIDPVNLEALALRADIRAARGDQMAFAENERGAREAWRAAIVDYDTLAEQAPDLATVFLSRAQTRRKLDDIDGAFADYGRAIDRDPKLATAYNERGLLYEVGGDYESALSDYTQAVRLAPKGPAGYRNKADALFALARFGEASVDYGQALELMPEFGDARVGRGRALAAQGLWEEALKDTADVLAMDAENREALGLQADIWAARGDEAAAVGDHQAAEAAYETAIAICDQAVALAPEDAAIVVTRASYRARTNQLQQALDDCDEAIALDPAQVDAYLLKGELHEALEDKEAALKVYERVIGLAPNMPDGYLHRGNLRLNREQYQMAVWDFNRTLDRGSNDAAPYLGRAYAFLGMYHGYNENGRYAKAHESAVKALRDCDRAIELGAVQDVDLYYNKGLMHLALEDFEASVQAFDLALVQPGVEPETRASILLSKAEASLGWGQQLHLEPQLKAALGVLGEAIDLTSDISLLGQLHETRGRVWLELCDYTEARAAFTQALNCTPLEPLPIIGRAKAAYFAEDYGKAREDFEALIDVHGGDRTVQLAHVGLGLTLEQVAQSEEAAQSFDNALTDPATTRAYLDRCDMFSEFRAFPHAEADLRQALTLEPESPEVLNSLAWISTEYQADEARLREAAEFAKRSVDLEGQGIARGNYLDTMGWVLHLMKQDQDALPYLQQAVALADYDQQIRHHYQVVEKALQVES